MSEDATQKTELILGALVAGRRADKQSALDRLDDPSTEIERPWLRSRLRSKIAEQARQKPRSQEEREESPDDVLPWLLSALARVSREDPEGVEVVKEHLDPAREPDRWVRFWALEGLVAAGERDVVEIAQGIRAGRDEDVLMRRLATAVLASDGDEGSIGEIEEQLNQDPDRWATLRALSVKPVLEAVDGLIRIIDEKGSHPADRFDAIVALGRVPPDHPEAAQAARTVATFIENNRRDPKWDGTRVQAIMVLGRLNKPARATTLLDDIVDDNPTVVREAARALEKVLQIRTAVSRIVEEAQTQRDFLERFANALRWMTDRDGVVRELEALVISGSPDEQEVARRLLSELGGPTAFQRLRALTDVAVRYERTLADAEVTVRGQFFELMKGARRGLLWVAAMDWIVFGVGVSLLLASAGVVLWNEGSLNSWAGVGLTAGAGVLGIIYGTLVANPRSQLEQSVHRLMRRQIIFLGYLRQLHQTGQAYARHLLDGETLAVGDVEQFSSLVRTAMSDALVQLQDPSPTAP